MIAFGGNEASFVALILTTPNPNQFPKAKISRLNGKTTDFFACIIPNPRGLITFSRDSLFYIIGILHLHCLIGVCNLRATALKKTIHHPCRPGQHIRRGHPCAERWCLCLAPHGEAACSVVQDTLLDKAWMKKPASDTMSGQIQLNFGMLV